MRLQTEEEAAAAQAGPRAPTVAPPNDTCAGAEVIPTTLPALSAVYDITDATTTGDPPVPGLPCTSAGALSRSIWFKFTPAITKSYALSTCASETGSTVDDVVMAVYTSPGGCAGPFTQLACDDDSCVSENLQARVVQTLTAGTDYYIVIWKFNSTAPTATNTSVQLRVGDSAAPVNDTCAGAIALPLNRSISGLFVDSGNDYTRSPCFFAPAQRQYRGRHRSGLFLHGAFGRQCVMEFSPRIRPLSASSRAPQQFLNSVTVTHSAANRPRSLKNKLRVPECRPTDLHLCRSNGARRESHFIFR